MTPSTYNSALRDELLKMRAEDLRVREQLAATRELFEAYHPTMEAVHLRNAARLEQLLAENNVAWFGQSIAGEDGAEAAWIILQHAISRPDLQRKMLTVLQREAKRGEVPLSHVAYLQDRILYMEGKPQIYGTQFDWRERDVMSAGEILKPETIDERRAAVGLSVPYAEHIKVHNEAVRRGGEPVPPDLERRERDFIQWARRTGWRD